MKNKVCWKTTKQWSSNFGCYKNQLQRFIPAYLQVSGRVYTCTRHEPVELDSMVYEALLQSIIEILRRE
jgi:hypothetical protein